jgi:hypothetical protein
LQTLFALSNLWMVRKHLLQARVRQFRVGFLGKCLVFSGLGALRFDCVMARFRDFPLTLHRFSE